MLNNRFEKGIEKEKDIFTIGLLHKNITFYYSWTTLHLTLIILLTMTFSHTSKYVKNTTSKLQPWSRLCGSKIFKLKLFKFAQQKTITMSKCPDSDPDQWFDEERPEPKIKSWGMAMDMVDDLLSFAESNTDSSDLMKDLAQSMSCLEKNRLKTNSEKNYILFLSGVTCII